MADGYVYASRSARSSAQEAHVQARLAQLAQRRRAARTSLSQDYSSQDSVGPQPSSSSGQLPPPPVSELLRRTVSGGSSSNITATSSNLESLFRDTIRPTSPSTIGESDDLRLHRRDVSLDKSMEQIRATTISSTESAAAAYSQQNHEAPLGNPFELRHGRRYLRDTSYPLPCDLAELQRRNLRTLLGCRVFGRAVCSPNVDHEMPMRVLEIGCGSGYWSSECHDWFVRLSGARHVEFTGLDMAPLASDLRKMGVNWKFVQHDIRRVPLPFDDCEFDLIMIRDVSMTLSLGPPYQQFLNECIRILREGGTIEVWESDHVIRSLASCPPPNSSRNEQDLATAEDTGTFCVASGTAFALPQNRYIKHANAWITEALGRQRLPATPCARVAQVLTQEPALCAVGSRRVAIPLGEPSWEREASRSNSGDLHDSPTSTTWRGKARIAGQRLSDDQRAIRQTALMTVLQMIEGMEPFLKEVSGKNTEEWGHWWASMMSDLTDPSKRALVGECLEVGAWWATKRYTQQ